MPSTYGEGKAATRTPFFWPIQSHVRKAMYSQWVCVKALTLKATSSEYSAPPWAQTRPTKLPTTPNRQTDLPNFIAPDLDHTLRCRHLPKIYKSPIHILIVTFHANQLELSSDSICLEQRRAARLRKWLRRHPSTALTRRKLFGELPPPTTRTACLPYAFV